MPAVLVISLSSTDQDDILQQLPSWTQHGDRFSAYGTVLRLCERAPESAFLDRPTFRRLPPSIGSDRSDTSSRPASHLRALPPLDDRLKAFDTLKFDQSMARTVVDLTSRQAMQIVLTPVAAQVGADVLDQLKQVSLTAVIKRTQLKLVPLIGTRL